ncbi:MAG: acyl-CoA thioesterase [Planctomycetota bacterium]
MSAPAAGAGAVGDASAAPFVHRLVVRFHEIDRAGIVYFGRVFEYCHVTYEEMLGQALEASLEAAEGGALERFFEQSTWLMPLVHAEADYKAPMRLGDALEVELRVERLGRSAVTFGYRVVGAGGRVHATAKLVHACVERGSFAKLLVPGSLVAGLEGLGLVAARGRGD